MNRYLRINLFILLFIYLYRDRGGRGDVHESEWIRFWKKMNINNFIFINLN